MRLDATTRAEYDALGRAADRAAHVVAALGSTVTVTVYDGSDAVRASGLMEAPWASAVDDRIVVGELASFLVTNGGMPDADWVLRFEGNGRWVEGSFGLSESGADFRWSLATFTTGQLGTIGTAEITAHGLDPVVADFSVTWNVLRSVEASFAVKWDLLLVAPLAFYGVPDPIQLYRGSAYNLAMHASGGVPPYTFSHTGSLPDGVTLTAEGLLVATESADIGLSGEIEFSVTDSAVPAGDAEADWLARSTGPGVLWAHDFREDAEFINFHKASRSPYLSAVTAPSPHPYHAELVSTPFGGSRAIRSRARGTTITVDVPAATVGQIQTFHVADATEIFAPWDGTYRILIDAKEYGIVHAVDHVNNTVTIERTNTQAYAAGARIGVGPQGRWIRPTACFGAGVNGKNTPDQGLVNGAATRERTFTTHVSFREGYFGHRTYWDPAYGDAPYKDWQPLLPSNDPLRPDAWEGDEFWLQFRAKVSASRITNPRAKMFYLQNCTGGGNAQLFWQAGPKNEGFTDVPADWPHGAHGAMLIPQTCYGDSTAKLGSDITSPQGVGVTTRDKTWADGEVEPAFLQDPETWPDSGYRGSSNRPKGWHLPVEKWVTFLLHMKPGRDSVVTYASSPLTQTTDARPLSDTSEEVLHLEDVSGFPDPVATYEYYVHTAKGTSPQWHENMRVVAVDYQNNTLTVRRNWYRSSMGSSNESIRQSAWSWDAGAVIAYGAYQGFPGKGSTFVTWPYGVSVDRRLMHCETVLELFVAVEGETEYTPIIRGSDYAWLYGDDKAGYAHYKYNPPGVNSIELAQYINDYVGSGGVRPPVSSHWIDYTQAIFSRNFIPCPQV